MITNSKPSSVLSDAWKRLEAVCRKLWDENSSSAIETQAVLEEFKGEVHRVEAQVANLDERREHERQKNEENLAALRRSYELELAGLMRRTELQEASMREKDARSEELLKTLARKEEENLNFHSQILRMSVTSDENKTKKMEEFYQELLKKEASLAESWQQRHLTLEQENEHRQKISAARQSELDAWQARRLGEEEAYNKRVAEIENKAQHLAQEYRKKQQEIEDLKASLQNSVTELVRQYQSRIRADGPEVTPHPR